MSGKMLTCRDIHRLIVERLDRTLSTEEESYVAQHIATCAGCLVFCEQMAAIGASQASCRLGHAANGSISVERVYVLTMQSRSGFSVTAPIGVQFRVAPDQRRGFRSRAWRYTS